LIDRPRKLGNFLFWVAIVGTVLGVASKLYIGPFLAWIFGIITFLASGSWFILATGPAYWRGYKVRPLFVFAGVIVLIIFIFAAIIGMYYAAYGL